MLLGAEVFSPLLLGELLGVSAFFWHAVKHIAKTSSNANTEINFFIENLLSFIVIYILLLLYKIINIWIVNSYTYLDDCTANYMKCLYEKLTLYYFALFRFNIILPPHKPNRAQFNSACLIRFVELPVAVLVVAYYGVAYMREVRSYLVGSACYKLCLKR